MRMMYFSNSHTKKEASSRKISVGKPILAIEEDELEDLLPIGDREFFCTLGMLIAGLGILGMTIGPFAIL